MFATHRLADADSLYRTGIDATGKIIINCPHFAKFAGQHLQRLHTQLFPVVNPQSVHLLRRYRSHSPETFNGQPGNKVQCLGRMYGAKPVRLAVVRGYLGKKLIIGYAGGSHQIQPLPHLPLYLLRDVYSQWNARFILRGIRSVNDFEYEKTIADVNRKLSGVETIILFTEPELTHISSTIVRELLRFGHSVDEFVPKGLKLV